MNYGIHTGAVALIVWNLFQRPTSGIFAALGLDRKEGPILLYVPLSSECGNFSRTKIPGRIGARARLVPVAHPGGGVILRHTDHSAKLAGT